MGCHFLPPGDVPDPGIEPVSPALAGRFFTISPLGKPAAWLTQHLFSENLPDSQARVNPKIMSFLLWLKKAYKFNILTI